MKTFITGKDAALEDSINRFTELLQKYDLEINEASWLNPVENIWSVHIHNKKCPACFSNGKGATKKAALASALGEYFERLSTNYYFSDFYLGKQVANADFIHYPNEKWFKINAENEIPEGLLTKELWDFYDPDALLTANHLIDLQSSNQERGIVALPFIRQSDDQTIYVPVNLIANIYASNGMAAGNTKFEARVQALSEIFERYVKNLILTQNISLPQIPDDVLTKYPSTLASIKALNEQGYPILCFDSSLGGIYPVICVVLFNPQNGTCYASFGAHPTLSVALERTVTELLQGRSLNQLDVFSPPSFNTDEVADLSNIETHFIDSSGLISWDMFNKKSDYKFVEWNFNNLKNSTEAQFKTLINIIHNQNHPVLIMDYEHLEVYACRIIAVGMSEIYPPEDLILANNNMAISWRDTILSLPKSNLSSQEYLALINKLDDEGFDDYARVRELLGIATGKDNAFYSLRIGELKAMLALAGQDLEQAHSWTEWTIQLNQSTFDAQRLHNYRCLLTLIEFVLYKNIDDINHYIQSFELLYGKKTVATIWQYVTGKNKFLGLFDVDENMTEFKIHQDLLDVYQKLHLAMKIKSTNINKKN